jgi:hypothetical protein
MILDNAERVWKNQRYLSALINSLTLPYAEHNEGRKPLENVSRFPTLTTIWDVWK